MDKKTRDGLEAAGYAVTSVEESFDLSPEEVALIDLKVALGAFLREQRARAGMTQAQLAERLGTRQPNVARMEQGGRGVTLDQLVRGLLACGASVRDVGRAIGAAAPGPAAAATRRAKRRLAGAS